MSRNYFSNYIGQQEAIAYLNRVIDAVAQGEKSKPLPLQPMAFLGNAGLGKTHLAKLVSDTLHKLDESWGYVELPSNITLPSFIEVWSDKIEGRKNVIFIDEADTKSLKNRGFLNTLKRLTETSKMLATVKVDVGNTSFNLTANPFEQLWIVATNEETADTALFGATGRFKTINLYLYNDEETKELIKSFARKAGIHLSSDSVVEYLASRVVPNARAISELIENECRLFGTSINLDLAKKVVKETGRFPRGLRAIDLKTLQFLGSDAKGKQIQEVAAHIAENERLTRNRITTLAGMGFAKTHAGKKLLTTDGVAYLKDISDKQKAKR